MKAALMIAAEEGGGREKTNVETPDIGISGSQDGAKQINECPWQEGKKSQAN